MDLMQLGRIGRSLRQIVLPLVAFLICLQAFEILMMPLVD
jgi:hypothetical protein